MSNLATIQIVKNVRPCPNADSLDIVQVLGWQVVTKRGEFAEGDLAVYVVIDTVLPEVPEFEFLRNKSFRIKPIKLRGEASAGIVFPTSILARFGYDEPLVEGTDVTTIIGVIHYERLLPPELAGQRIGGLPSFLIMTDEDNLRSYPRALSELNGKPYYITQKDDGSSATFYIKDNVFGVCSRKVDLKENDSNSFWKIAKTHDIENALRSAFPNTDIAIQGELCGPGIQKNKIRLTQPKLSVFNLFDIRTQSYFGYEDLTKFTSDYNLSMVKLIGAGSAFDYSLEDLLVFANKQQYSTDNFAEGIVIRPKVPFYSNILKKAWSGKVLNENYKQD